MTTKEMIRCKDCGYLVEGDNGEWLCENCYYEDDVKDIHDIETCPFDEDVYYC